MYASRCSILTSDGRRCSSFVYPGHSTLCHHHLRQELDGAPPSEDIAADILDSIQNFQSAASINAALGKIFTLLAAGRIKRQDALSMAYLCQLMLQSLKELKSEMALTTHNTTFVEDLLNVLNDRTPLAVFVSPPPPEAEAQHSHHPDFDESAEPQPAPATGNQEPSAAVLERPVSHGDHQMEDEENEKDLELASIQQPETEEMEV